MVFVKACWPFIRRCLPWWRPGVLPTGLHTCSHRGPAGPSRDVSNVVNNIAYRSADHSSVRGVFHHGNVATSFCGCEKSKFQVKTGAGCSFSRHFGLGKCEMLGKCGKMMTECPNRCTTCARVVQRSVWGAGPRPEVELIHQKVVTRMRETARNAELCAAEGET